MTRIRDIIAELSEYSPKLLIEPKQNTIITHISSLEKDTDYQPNGLYIGTTSQVRNDVKIQGISFFLFQDDETVALPIGQENTILFFPDETQLDSVKRRCEKLVSDKAKLFEDTAALFDCFASSTDFSEVVETASQIIGNPLIVLDESFKVLAHSVGYAVEDVQWQENIQKGYCSYEYIAIFLDLNSVRHAPESNQPFIGQCFTSPLRRCMSKLFHHNKQIGYILAIEAVTPFEEMNDEIFVRISNLIAKMVTTENRLQARTGTASYDRVFIDGLEGNFKSRGVFTNCIEMAGFRLHSSYQVLVLDLSMYHDLSVAEERLRTKLQRLFYGCWSVCYNNAVVVLIDCKGLRTDVLTLLDDPYFAKSNLRIGISDVFHDLYTMSFYYNQAISALQLSAKFGMGETLSEYNQYKFYDFATRGIDLKYMPSYYSKDLARVLQHDLEHNTQYCEIIRIFIESNQSLTQAAKRLHVHKNTVYYRISKIKELFAIDLDDPLKRFQIYYSLLLLDIKNSSIS